MVERAVGLDEELMKKFLDNEDSIAPEELYKAIRQGTIANKMVPVTCGASFKNKGVQKLLDTIIAFLPSPLDLPPVEGDDINDAQKKLQRKAEHQMIRFAVLLSRCNPTSIWESWFIPGFIRGYCLRGCIYSMR